MGFVGKDITIGGKKSFITRDYNTESEAREEQQRLRNKGIFSRVWIASGSLKTKNKYMVIISKRDYERRGEW